MLEGRTHGPYGSAEEAVSAQELRAKRMRKSAGHEAALHRKGR